MLTFGKGVHYCSGKPIAEALMKLVIYKFLTGYEISLAGKDLSSTNVPNPKLNYFTLGIIVPETPVKFSLRKL